MFENERFKTKLMELTDLSQMEGGWGDKKWTYQIKNVLVELAPENSAVHTCADEVEADNPEWLFDVAWMEYSSSNFNRPLKKLLLAAESEWGNKGDVLDDFEKLLVARAQMRVMVFHDSGPNIQSKSLIEELKELAKNFAESEVGDRYVFACHEKSHGKFLVDDWTLEELSQT